MLQIFYVVIGHPALESSNEATHVDAAEGAEQELEVVPAPSVSHSLVFLDQYTRYRIHIVAFNPAGDGPPSSPITVTTLQVCISSLQTRDTRSHLFYSAGFARTSLQLDLH